MTIVARLNKALELGTDRLFELRVLLVQVVSVIFEAI